MKNLLINKMMVCVGILLLFPLLSIAEPYRLVSQNMGHPTGSRSLKRPLIIDLVEHTLTLPRQVIGSTLLIENEDGERYTWLIADVVIMIPIELHGKYYIHIIYGDDVYSGVLNF